MKVLLVQPPIQDFYDTDVRLQPIGLCYLKAAVKKHLPDVEIVIRDYHGSFGRKTAPLPNALAYLRAFPPLLSGGARSRFTRKEETGRTGCHGRVACFGCAAVAAFFAECRLC